MSGICRRSLRMLKQDLSHQMMEILMKAKSLFLLISRK